MQVIRCAHCHRKTRANPRVKQQTHCGRAPCQRARKAKWQRQKMKTDPVYRLNQQESNQQWQNRNPEYWKEYRHNHEAYTSRNRLLQRERDRRSHQRSPESSALAKMDTSDAFFNLKAGKYLIVPQGDQLAKMDALTVNIIPITPG